MQIKFLVLIHRVVSVGEFALTTGLQSGFEIGLAVWVGAHHSHRSSQWGANDVFRAIAGRFVGSLS